jgi:hypothetical protein
MRRGSLFWGVLLVLIGVVLLMDNLGLLGNISVWNLIWPVVLILIGARILYGTVFRKPPTSEHASVPLEGAQRARVKIQHGAGRLDVHAGGGMGVLAEGDFVGGVNVRSQREGDDLSVKMSVPENFFPFDWTPGNTLDWSLGLNREIPIALEFETGAGEARLDLRDLRVSEVRLKSGASSTTIELPTNAGSTRVSVEAGAASVVINVPSGVAARIRSEGGLSSIEVDTNRFSMAGSNLYQSPDFDTAQNKVEMEIHMGVGSVKIG